ncbi:DEAD/DEAH box helicase [Amycolatopsis sp. H20-H5]|uniref:DEAD/DEAH box helicase n=1 Tax=Amycolatopsis sp. H20-H5 TaxID=3046309 RepID=UPI002DBBE345|nr:DEAD/DEAH box helicase [Amycolatopsis sp. H20-H5]MEC3976790.1 DEAD/DEAH box helicase [Amycolatopsis sp. H20-H5]
MGDGQLPEGEQLSRELIEALARCAVLVEPADPPRTGRVVFLSPGDEPPPVGDSGVLTIVDRELASRASAVTRLPIAEALPLLVRLRDEPGCHPAAAFWSAATVAALRLVAAGRLLPVVTEAGHDAWRAGPIEPADVVWLRGLAEAMPAEAHAVAVPGDSDEPRFPARYPLLRAFVDAVADTLPRTPAAARATGTSAFAAVAPQQVPALRDWAGEVSAGLDSGVKVSLRVDALDDDFTSGRFRAVVQVHSLTDPAQLVDAGQLWAGGDGFGGFGPRARVDVMLALRRGAQVWPPLEPLLGAVVPDELGLGDVEIAELLADAAPRLAAAGIDVHWPTALARDLTAKAVVGTTDDAPSDLPSFFGGHALLGFDWQLALGGEPLTPAEMDRLAEAHRPIVRLRDRWILVDPALAAKARDRMLKPLTPMDALGVALSGTAEIDGERVDVITDGWLDSLRERLSAPPEPLEQPAELAATLRDYQLRGLRWLSTMTAVGLGGCLADDMGLGKTITLIALHLCRQADPATVGPTLVVCPASLLGNWEREIRRFAPATEVRRFHGTERALGELGTGFVLTTYGTVRADTASLATPRWGLLVADEAQHVKNPRSSTAEALRELPSAARIALTGTPVENNLSELWAILDWTTPGLLGTLPEFRRQWAKPVEAGTDPAAGERLSRLIRPFLLRRRKIDPGIAPELPAKTETDRPVTLTAEQAGLYEAVVRELMADIAGSEGIARRGRIVKLLTGLKQICNHPAQYLKEPGEATLRGRSGKLELLDELLDTILAEDGAVLVFTQYVAMARLIERHLAERGVPTQLLHGGTPVPRREELVQRFQRGEVPVFLLSLKAAGTGLNLTRAEHVVHYDRWWNPAVEDQATDRAYRIGQTRPVQVHRLIAEGTVEDRIAEMLRAKRALADAVLTSGEAALTELTDHELAELVELRSRR